MGQNKSKECHICINATKRASNVSQIHISQLSLLKPQALGKLKPCARHHESRKIKRQTINFNLGYVSDVLWCKGSPPGTPAPTFWKQFGEHKTMMTVPACKEKQL